MANSSPIVVVADDRTGALETAGRIAQRTGQAVEVRCLVDGASAEHAAGSPMVPICVVDIASRHLVADRAAGRILRLARAIGRGSRVLHKMDSLLRGNWDAEVRALCTHAGSPAVVVAALPEAGRTCSGGVVCADGVPVDRLTDARAAATTSRPAMALDAAEVDLPALAEWLDDPEGIAVCDAESAGDVAEIAEQLAATPGVIVSATAEVLAHVVAGAPAEVAVPPSLAVPCVVIVGSVHPTAIAQADAVAELVDVTVVRSVVGGGRSAEEVIADLVERSRPLLAAARTVVVVGGDTAAAALGTAPMRVFGMVGPGMPWLHSAALPGVVVITKPGSHGDSSTLVDVLSARIRA